MTHREVVVIAIQQIEEVINRLSTDKAFRMKYRQNPDTALETYLSPEEIHAIKTGDGYWLAAMGCGNRWGELTAALCGSDPGP